MKSRFTPTRSRSIVIRSSLPVRLARKAPLAPIERGPRPRGLVTRWSVAAFLLALCLLATVLGLAGKVASADTTPPPPDPLETPTVLVGDQPDPDVTVAAMAAASSAISRMPRFGMELLSFANQPDLSASEIAELQGSKVGVVRLPVAWSEIQDHIPPSGGCDTNRADPITDGNCYNQTQLGHYDRLLSTLTSHAIAPMIMVVVCPVWACGVDAYGNPNYGGPLRHDHKCDSDRTRDCWQIFDSFVTALVKHYTVNLSYKVNYWEFWNEPDGNWPAQDYVSLMHDFYGYVKQWDPTDSVVLNGGFASESPTQTTFMQQAVQNGLGGSIDALAFHFYPSYYYGTSSASPKDKMHAIQTVIATVTPNAKVTVTPAASLPMIVNEMGYPSLPAPTATPTSTPASSNPGSTPTPTSPPLLYHYEPPCTDPGAHGSGTQCSYPSPSVPPNPTIQARNVITMNISAASAGLLNSDWYVFHDYPGASVCGELVFYYDGLTSNDPPTYTPKASLNAMDTLGIEVGSDTYIAKLSNLNSNLEGHALRPAPGLITRHVWAVWNQTDGTNAVTIPVNTPTGTPTPSAYVASNLIGAINWNGTAATITTNQDGSKTINVGPDPIFLLWPRFDDVPLTHWAYGYIEDLVTNKLVLGYPDYTFHPQSAITRGQLAKIIALGMVATPGSGWTLMRPTDSTFQDVPVPTQPNDTDSPFFTYVETIHTHGVANGYPCGTPPAGSCVPPANKPYFLPLGSATRGQAVQMMVIAKGWPYYTTGGPHFTDVQPGSTFYNYVETALHYGITSGYGDGTFRPDVVVTRAQAMKMWDLAFHQ